MTTEMKNQVGEERAHEGSSSSDEIAGRLPEEVHDLHGIVKDALEIRPRRYVRSIFGPLLSWLPPHRATSELRIVSPWRLWRTVKFLVEVSVPSILRKFRDSKTGWGAPEARHRKIFLKPARILHEPDPGGRYDTFPAESWFFVNGVATNEPVARMNARCLADLTRRPITVIHNATDSVGVDLLECALGKGWEVMSRPACRAYPLILEALKDPAKERVIVVAHSQGTIITANVLRALYSSRFKAHLFERRATDAPRARQPMPDDPYPEYLGKLEVYAFANCADTMLHHPDMASKRVDVPWIESFANELDLVARLGMLAPRKELHGIRIEGASYVKRGKWGHLLNVHYLHEIGDILKAGRPEEAYAPAEGSPLLPRFYGYFDGQTPEPY